MNVPIWALRDVKHGKTFQFASLEELVAFVEKLK